MPIASADMLIRLVDPVAWQVLLDAARAIERVPELLGLSPHLIGTRGAHLNDRSPHLRLQTSLLVDSFPERRVCICHRQPDLHSVPLNLSPCDNGNLAFQSQ
jgi:hypothetical protein